MLYYGELSQKYKAEVYKILGFVFLTPTGHTVLSWMEQGFPFTLVFLARLCLSILLAFIGHAALDASGKILIDVDQRLELKKKAQ